MKEQSLFGKTSVLRREVPSSFKISIAKYRLGNMKENVAAANVGAICGRMTRSRAAALGCASSNVSRRDRTISNLDSTTFRVNSSNGANSGCFHGKRKAALQDVTNIRCKSTSVDCFTATKVLPLLCSSVSNAFQQYSLV